MSMPCPELVTPMRLTHCLHEDTNVQTWWGQLIVRRSRRTEAVAVHSACAGFLFALEHFSSAGPSVKAHRSVVVAGLDDPTRIVPF